MTDKTNELKCCPFCGSEARLTNGYSDNGSTIRCAKYSDDCPVGPGVFEEAPSVPWKPDNPQSTWWLDFSVSDAKAIERWNRRYDHAAAELRWIPVSDPSELPKGKLYLITLANGTVCDSSGFTGFIPQVTAWMPLPKPYTEPADKTAEVGEREGVMNHQYEGQLEEPDDDWFDDEEGSYCDACDEFGMYVICVDDLCHSGSGCIHGDGEILCPHCKGKGKL